MNQTAAQNQGWEGGRHVSGFAEANRHPVQSMPGHTQVHSMWIGPKMSAIQWACMKSFLDTGHEFYLYTDDTGRRLPAGVVPLPLPGYVSRTPWRYGPRAGVNAGSVAIFADLLRAEHLYRHGGWWTDLDVISLKPLPQIPKSGLAVGWQDDAPEMGGHKLANVAVLGSAPGHYGLHLLRSRILRPWLGSPWEPFWKRIYHALQFWDTTFRPWNTRWGFAGGPQAVTGLVRYLDLEQEVFEPDVFYPVRWRNWSDLLVEDFSQIPGNMSSCVAVHLWAELYRSANIDVNSALRGSWMRRYLDDWIE